MPALRAQPCKPRQRRRCTPPAPGAGPVPDGSKPSAPDVAGRQRKSGTLSELCPIVLILPNADPRRQTAADSRAHRFSAGRGAGTSSQSETEVRTILDPTYPPQCAQTFHARPAIDRPWYTSRYTLLAGCTPTSLTQPRRRDQQPRDPTEAPNENPTMQTAVS